MTERPFSRRRLALFILAIVVPSLDTITLESGKRTAIGEPVFGDDQFRGVGVHPDGDKLTFWRGSGQLQLWVLEGIEW